MEGAYFWCMWFLSACLQWQPIQWAWYLGGGGPGCQYRAPHQWRWWVCPFTVPLIGVSSTGVPGRTPSSFPNCVLFERRKFQCWYSVANLQSLFVCFCTLDSSVFDQLFPCSLLICPVTGRAREKLFQSAHIIFWHNVTFLVTLLSTKTKLVKSVPLNIAARGYLPLKLYFYMNLKAALSKVVITT